MCKKDVLNIEMQNTYSGKMKIKRSQHVDLLLSTSTEKNFSVFDSILRLSKSYIIPLLFTRLSVFKIEFEEVTQIWWFDIFFLILHRKFFWLDFFKYAFKWRKLVEKKKSIITEMMEKSMKQLNEFDSKINIIWYL